MTNKQIIDKYDVLFASSAEFVFRVQLCKREEVEGASDEEIQNFCNTHNVNIPASFWSYTRTFGKKARCRDTDYNCGYSLADYDYALHQAGLREEWHEMMTVKELLKEKNFKVNYDSDSPDDNEGLYTPPINSLMNIDDIFVFHYDEFTRNFKFADTTTENPCIFYFTRYYALSSAFSSFTNRFRDILFVYIVNFAPQDFAEMGYVDKKRVAIGLPPTIDYSDGFECIKTYQEMFKSKTLDRHKLKMSREAFYLENDKIEKEENRILSFTEFENNFIAYLKKHNLTF